MPDGLPKKTSSVPAGPAPTEFGSKRVGVIEGLIMWHEPQKSAAVLVGLPSVTPHSIPMKCSALTKLLRCIYPGLYYCSISLSALATRDDALW